ATPSLKRRPQKSNRPARTRTHRTTPPYSGAEFLFVDQPRLTPSMKERTLMNTKTTRKLSALGLIAALSLTGCAQGSISGGADTGSDSNAGSGLAKATIGLFPSSAVGAIQLGINKGYFEEEGIDLEMLLGQGSAAQLPSLTSGSLEF